MVCVDGMLTALVPMFAGAIDILMHPVVCLLKANKKFFFFLIFNWQVFFFYLYASNPELR